MCESSGFNRREFGKQLTIGAALAAALEDAAGSEASAQEEKAVIPENATPVDLLIALIKRQYADKRLNAETLVEVRSDLEQQLARSQKLSSVPLTNADEPATIRTYRKD